MRQIGLRALAFTSACAGLLGGLLLVGPPGAASASSRLSFSVNTKADAHDAHPGNGRCADAAGRCSVRVAIEASNAAQKGTITTEGSPVT